MKNIWCDYDEAYTKADAEDIGFCGNCRITSCEKSKAFEDVSVKEKLIADLIKELGEGRGRAKRIRKIVEKYLSSKEMQISGEKENIKDG